MPSQALRVVLHLDKGLKEIVDAGDVYYFEAAGPDTRVRLGGRRLRREVRTLGEIERLLGGRGFFRTSRSHLVNLSRIRFLRRREEGDGWEIKLEPPVNAVLPVSQRKLTALTRALEGR